MCVIWQFNSSIYEGKGYLAYDIFMSKPFKLFCAAFLLMGMIGCAIHIDLVPGRISVVNIGRGRKIFIGKFTDKRELSDTYVMQHPGVDLEHYVGSLNHEKPVFSNESPIVLFRDSIRRIMEDAGFDIVGDEVSKGTIELRGTIVDFCIDQRKSEYGVGLAPDSVVDPMDIHLVFLRDGKILADQHIYAVTQGHPFGQLGKYYPVQTFNKVMHKAADYVESASFQEEVLGVTPEAESVEK
jgi:hypothetical protein